MSPGKIQRQNVYGQVTSGKNWANWEQNNLQLCDRLIGVCVEQNMCSQTALMIQIEVGLQVCEQLAAVPGYSMSHSSDYNLDQDCWRLWLLYDLFLDNTIECVQQCLECAVKTLRLYINVGNTFHAVIQDANRIWIYVLCSTVTTTSICYI
jgi:hypothetical protein